MSVTACAALVQRGDPDRFRATMAAPVRVREKLFPLYAFNLEVARAPWVTAEPLIAEMRLQWWQDVLDEIAGGRAVRRHEVATPLAEVLPSDMVPLLARLIEARRQDIVHGPGDGDSLMTYLAETGGTLMTAAGLVLGAAREDEDALHRIGTALACANWLRAWPALVAAGKQPFGLHSPEVLPGLAERALRLVDTGPLSRPGRIAALSAWQTSAVLRKAAQDSTAITEGRLEPGPARARLALTLAALRR